MTGESPEARDEALRDREAGDRRESVSSRSESARGREGRERSEGRLTGERKRERSGIGLLRYRVVKVLDLNPLILKTD